MNGHHRHWWQLYPDRWRAELDAFAARGWPTWVDHSRTHEGIIAITTRYPMRRPRGDGPEARATPAPTPTDDTPGEDITTPVPLTVHYPSAYPFFPPSVCDPTNALALVLRRHRNPASRVLCLTSASSWQVHLTAAELIDTQLPRLRAAGTATDPPATGVEVPAGEPASTLVVTTVHARVVVDSHWHIPPALTHGSLRVAFADLQEAELGPGIVTHVGGDGVRARRFPTWVLDQFPAATQGAWLRWSQPDAVTAPVLLWARVTHHLRKLSQVSPPTATLTTDRAGDQVIGLLVPSETRYRRWGTEWFFLVRHRPDRGSVPIVDLVAGVFGGATDVHARTPTTRRCHLRRVLLVGVGAVGGTIAAELARAGVGALDLVDPDTVDPATSCRQLAPIAWAGLPKALVTKAVLHEQHPHTRVRGFGLRLGGLQSGPPGTESTHALLGGLVAAADLVIDAAADPAVSRYLAALAVATRTVFLHASATAGAYGGVVAMLPGDGACWWCLQHHRGTGTIPFPRAAPARSGFVAPAGCAEPTFTGTGADLTTIASHASRVALWHLAAAAPSTASTLYTAALRDGRGRPIPVTWETTTLPVHASCPVTTAHRDSRLVPAGPPAGADHEGSGSGS